MARASGREGRTFDDRQVSKQALKFAVDGFPDAFSRTTLVMSFSCEGLGRPFCKHPVKCDTQLRSLELLPHGSKRSDQALPVSIRSIRLALVDTASARS